MQFSDLYGPLLDRELGSADTALLFTVARRKAAINEAQREWARVTESYVRTQSIPIVSAVAEYDVESAAPDFWWLAPQGVEVQIVDAAGGLQTISGDDLPRRDVVWLNRESPGWRTSAGGRPAAFYERSDAGVHVVGLAPAPVVGAGETWTLVVPYVAEPADMSNDIDEPFAMAGNSYRSLRPWHEALAHYAAASLEGLRKDTERRGMQLERWNNYTIDYVQRQRRRSQSQPIAFARDYLRDAHHGGGAVVQGDPRV